MRPGRRSRGAPRPPPARGVPGGSRNPASVSGCGAPVPAPPLGSKKLSPSGPSRRVRPLAGHQTQVQPLRPQPLPFLTFNGRRLSQPGRLGGWGARPPPAPPPASQAAPRPCSRAPTLRTGRPGPGGRQHGQQQPGQLTWAALVLEPPEHQGPLHCHTSTVSAEPAKALQSAGVGKEASSEQGNLGTRGPVPHQESNLAGPHVLLGGNGVPLCSEASVLRGQRDVSVSEASGHRTAGPVCWAVCPAY